MKARTLSTAVLVLGLVLLIFVFGVQAGIWVLAALAALAQYEIYGLFNRLGMRPLRRLGIGCGLLLVLGTYYLPDWIAVVNLRVGTDLFILGIVACSLGVIVIDREAPDKYQSLVATLFGLLYIPYMLHFLAVLIVVYQPGTSGLFLALWVIATAKASDIGALLTGSLIGRTPLARSLSPKKTWEGVLGGVGTAVLVASAFAYLADDYLPADMTVWMAALVAAPIAAVAVLSDLVESLFKRQAGVKDSGGMVPGIGGAFDLVDSLTLSAPFAFFLFKYILLVP